MNLEVPLGRLGIIYPKLPVLRSEAPHRDRQPIADGLRIAAPEFRRVSAVQVVGCNAFASSPVTTNFAICHWSAACRVGQSDAYCIPNNA
jgi:hypothetical protein